MLIGVHLDRWALESDLMVPEKVRSIRCFKKEGSKIYGPALAGKSSVQLAARRMLVRAVAQILKLPAPTNSSIVVSFNSLV